MENKTKAKKWTKKLKAIVISLGLAFAVALGGACAAIGLSLSDNDRLGGYSAGGVDDEITTPAVPEADETFYAGVTVGETTYSTNAEAWAAAVDYSITENAVVQFNLTRSWTGVSATGFGTATETDSPFGAAGSLNVPTGATIILNISKNVKLNRNVGATAIDNGSVITVVGGTLYITGDGIITGGNNNGSGGALDIASGTVNINKGVITGNKTGAHGGGIFSNGKLTINGGTISKNTATNTTSYSNGGGVYVATDGEIVINGGTISDNTAKTHGGGVLSFGKFVMKDGVISNNTVNECGGGIVSYTDFTMEGGTVSGNTGTTSAGGGIWASGVATISGDAVISNNFAGTSGGGVYAGACELTISGNAEISNNMAPNGGGVFINETSTLEMTGGTISDNTATGTTKDAANNIVDGGGAVFLVKNATFTMEDGVISGNSAYYGGAIRVEYNATINIFGGDIYGNKASYGGGVIASSDFRVGGKEIGIVNIGTEEKKSTVKIHDNYSAGGGGVIAGGPSIYSNSPADSSDYVEIYNNVCETEGAVIAGNYDMTIVGGKYYNNVNGLKDAYGGSVIILYGQNSGANLTIKNAEFSDNVSHGTYGAIYYKGDGADTKLKIENCIFNNNTAATNGGAIFAYNSPVEITDSTFTGNKSYSHGGAIYQGSGTMELEGCTFEGNVSTSGVGGGVYMLGKAKITDCDFTGNKATDGGGIYLTNNNKNELEMKNVTVTGNSASKYGGGMTAGIGTSIALDGKIDISGNTLLDGSTSNVLYSYLGTNFHVAEGGSITAGSKMGFHLSHVDTTDATRHVFFTGAVPSTLELTADNPEYYDVSSTSTQSQLVIKSTLNSDNATRWNAAVAESLSKYSATNTDPDHNQVTFELLTNWIADTAYKFGAQGDGINANGTIVVPKNANIVLNLHQSTIDRGCRGETRIGVLMLSVEGTLTIIGDGFIGGSYNLHYGTAPISVSNGGTINMYGGNIQDNKGGAGGAIVISDGTFNMYSGKISGNVAESGMYNSAPTGGLGGAIYMYRGTFNMYGGTICGNTAEHGGAIYATGGTVNLYGGVIGGTAANTAYNGGGIMMAGGTLNFGKKDANGKLSGDAIISGNIGTHYDVENGICHGGGVNVASSATMNMYSGKITGNNIKTGGGGVAVFGEFNMYGGIISGNTSNSYGGGIHITSSGEMTMSGGQIKGNTAPNSSGGINLDGKLTMTGGEISGNTTLMGAGVCVQPTGEFIMGAKDGNNYTGTGKILNNKAKTDKATDTLGGGVFVNAASDGSTRGKFTLYKGEISGNSASYGGGVFVLHYGNFEMFDGTIGKNTATANGGGLYVGDPSMVITETLPDNQKDVVKIHGGEISGNSATTLGGGVYVRLHAKLTIDGGTFKNNNAGGAGGILLGEHSTGTISGNTQIINNNAGASGGGITVWNGASLTIDGADVKVDGNNGNSGGGIYVQPTGKVTLNNGSISGNTTVTHGAGLYVSNGEFTMNDGEIAYNNAAGAGGGVDGSASNSTIKLFGGSIHHNTAGWYGGGLSIGATAKNMASVTVSGDMKIYSNSSFGSTGGGGGFYISGGATLTMEGGEIYENSSAVSGGGVFVSGASTFNMTAGVIRDNYAETQGGGVYVLGEFTMGSAARAAGDEPRISGNDAGSGGGVMVSAGATFNMYSGVIGGDSLEDGNTAIRGGGVYNGGTLVMSNGKIKYNQAVLSGIPSGANYGGHGGGVYLALNSSFTLDDGEISYNTAGSNGGGINGGGTCYINGGIIAHNSAVVSGGIEVSSTTTITGGTVSDNTAEIGAGIYVVGDSTFNVSGNPVVVNNTLEDDTVNNVYLYSGKKITVTGTLDSAARIGVSAGATVPVTVTADFGSKNTTNAATLARNVFFADKEGEVAVLSGSEVQLAQGVVLTVKDEKENKLGSITTVLNATTPATVTGNYTEETQTFAVSETGAAANVVNLDMSGVVRTGYEAYMYVDQLSKTDVTKTGVSMNTNKTVYIAERALERTYTITYMVPKLAGGYDEVVVERTGYTNDKVVVVDKNGVPFLDLASAAEYGLESGEDIYDEWKNVKIAGDNSTNVTVYLRINEYTVRFSSAGAVPPYQERVYKYGQTLSLEGINNPVKELSTFSGWYYVDDNGNEVDIDDDNPYTVTKDVQIFARFTTKTYKIVFDLNIGEDTDKYQLDLDYVLSLSPTVYPLVSQFVNQSYKVSWDTAAMFDNSFDFGGEGSDKANGKYAITYSVDNITTTTKSITAAKPSAIGYTFKGWYASATASAATSIIRKPTAKNEPNAVITLTARWEPTTYTIRFDGNGNGYAARNVDIKNLSVWGVFDKDSNEYSEAGNVLPDVPKRAGYKFTGWYVSETAADENEASAMILQRSTSIPNADDENLEDLLFSVFDFTDIYTDYNFSNITLYAGWASLDIDLIPTVTGSSSSTVAFYKGTNQVSGNNPAHIGDEIRVELTHIEGGYEFKRLNILGKPTRQLSEGVLTFTITNRDVIEEDEDTFTVNVEAVFEESTYTITYERNGGTSADPSSSISRTYSVTSLAKGVKLPSLMTKNGYDFNGWYIVDDNQLAHDIVSSGKYYNADLKLSVSEFRNITLRADWKAQAAPVYLYNATYDELEGYEKPEGTNYYKIERYNNVTIVTGSEIQIINPVDDVFDFLGWAKSRNGAIVYPAEYDEDGNITTTISYTANADHDSKGNALNNNNLYAVWHIKGVDRINITVENNNTTYGGLGVTMKATPAQKYSDDNANIKLIYKWYRIYEGMYDQCFEEGFVYISGGKVTGYKFGNQYYEANGLTTTNTRPAGEEVEGYKRFDASKSTGDDACCKLVATQPIAPEKVAAGDVTSTQTIKNVSDCGIYVCVVEVSASLDGSDTRTGGYGEIEISMRKATYTNITVEDKTDSKSLTYNGEVRWSEITATRFDKSDGSEVTRDEFGVIRSVTLPDKLTKVTVNYQYFVFENSKYREITDRNEIKNAGNYQVVVSFEFASGGDAGNYEELSPVEAYFTIKKDVLSTIESVFMHDGTKSDAPFADTYDGKAYGVEFKIKDTFESTGKLVTEVDDICVQVTVYKVTENGDVEISAANLPTINAGTYVAEIIGLSGTSAGNYELGNVSTRKEYTITKKTYDVADKISFNDLTVEYDDEVHTISISIESGYSLPDTVEVVYDTDYFENDEDFTATSGNGNVDNGGKYAGTYIITVSFVDSAAENHEALESMTATLTIEKADFLGYHNKDGADLLRDGGFVDGSYKFVVGASHNPCISSGMLTSNNFDITYDYYRLNETENAASDNDWIMIGSGTHEALTNAGKLISDAGKYKVVARIDYLDPYYRNNFKEIEESKATITYAIRAVNVEEVIVHWNEDTSAWASGSAMTVNLGDTFDYSWIDHITVVYAEEAGTADITGDDVKLAGISFGMKGKEEQNAFWHVGNDFTLYVSFYGTSSNNTFTVKEYVTDFTLKYRVGDSGAYSPIPTDGLPILAEGEYSFIIEYECTDGEGNTVTDKPSAAIAGADLVLGKNVLTVTEDFYNFAEISVDVYKVITGEITWMYSTDNGKNWRSIEEDFADSDYDLPYIGSEYLIGAAFEDDGPQLCVAKTVNGEPVLNYKENGYKMQIGRSGNYKIDVSSSFSVSIAKRVLEFTWSDEEEDIVYNGLAQAPEATDNILDADKESVTYKFVFKDENGGPLQSYEVIGAGTYVISVVLTGDEQNYTLNGSESAEHTFVINKAEVELKVTYSESNYGENVTYAGNAHGLRQTALKATDAVVSGKFAFVKEGATAENYKEYLISGDDQTIKSKLTGTAATAVIDYAYIPDDTDNYNVKIDKFTITVSEQKAKTGANSLLIVLGKDSTTHYLVGGTFTTKDIVVYKLYESYYTEGNNWFGFRGDSVGNPTFMLNGNTTANGHQILEEDISGGMITLVASKGPLSGSLQIPVLDKKATDLEITSTGHRTVFYVGETYDFSDMVFKATLEGPTYQEGLVKGAVKCDYDGVEFTEKGFYTVKFSYFDAECPLEIEVRDKEDLQIVEFTTSEKTLIWTGDVLTAPALKFRIDGDNYSTYDGITVTSRAMKGASTVQLKDEGKYWVYYTITITNPRFNRINVDKIVEMEVTKNPYRLTITPPAAGELSKTFTGSNIPIPQPEIGDIIDSRTDEKVDPDSITYTINGTPLTQDEISKPWNRLHAGSYVVEVVVSVDGREFSETYTFEITKATIDGITIVTNTVVLNGNENFKFPVTAKSGADTVTFEYTVTYTYSQSKTGEFTANVPNQAGKWFVKATIADTSDYIGFEKISEFSFEVRENEAGAAVGEGSIAGGDGIGKDWSLEIKQLAAETVSQVSISKQNVLDGYKVELRNEDHVLVTPEKEYSVKIKLSDELKGKSGLKIFFKDANGKVKELKATVKDGNIEFNTKDFNGEYFITTAVAKASVGPLVAVIILGVIAAAGIALCIIVFVKKRKRGANQ